MESERDRGTRHPHLTLNNTLLVDALCIAKWWCLANFPKLLIQWMLEMIQCEGGGQKMFGPDFQHPVHSRTSCVYSHGIALCLSSGFTHFIVCFCLIYSPFLLFSFFFIGSSFPQIWIKQIYFLLLDQLQSDTFIFIGTHWVLYSSSYSFLITFYSVFPGTETIVSFPISMFLSPKTSWLFTYLYC